MKRLSYLLLVSALIGKAIYAMDSKTIEIELIYENKEIPGEFIADNEDQLNDFLEFHAQFPAAPMPILRLKRTSKSTEPKVETQERKLDEEKEKNEHKKKKYIEARQIASLKKN